MARTNLFDAVVSSKKFQINNLVRPSEGEKLPLGSWLDFYRMQQILSSESFEVVLKLLDGKTVFSNSGASSAKKARRFTNEVRILEKFRNLRIEAKAKESEINLQQIFDVSDEIDTVHAYFLEPENVGIFSFKFCGDLPDLAKKCPVLLVMDLVVGEEKFGYGLKFDMDVSFEGETYSFVSTFMKPLQIVKLESSADSLRDFGDQLGRISGVSLRVISGSELEVKASSEVSEK